MPTKPRFKACMLAVLVAAMPLFTEAAGLSRLNVLSGLGQPFKGEIDLVAVQPNEVETLKVSLGSVEAYSAAQLSYPATSLGLRLALEKRANGQYFVQISSKGAIDEPVFNLLVDLSWLGGRIQREYTALIDPVGYSTVPTSASIAPAMPSATPAAAGTARAPAETVNTPRVSSAINPPKAPARQTQRSKPAVAATASAPEAEQTSETYAVKAGDTLSSIAGRVKPDGVSLEQVLVGLYKTNQDAFDGNMNRLKRGKILRVPTAADLEATSKPEAIKEIKAQSANWQKYRRQLAESTAKSPAAETTEQAAGGRITAKVEDQGAKAADKSKDVLKLSRGASKTDSAANRVRALEEEAASRKKALDEANQRVVELQKNVKKMEELQAALKTKSGAELQQKAEQVKASVAAPVAPVKPVAASPVAAVPASATEAASKPAEVAASVAEIASAVAAPASPAAEQVKPKRVAPPPPPPAPEPGIVDMLAENALPIGGGLAVVLLGAGGLIWSRNRRRPSVFENSLITSGDLKPNTVLGRTGGGVISTQAENSFLTDFSRQGLGTIDTDEVDPIAEADVYMAYGRNAQAEEILKDALVKDPHRQEIRLKLLDIFAARKDKTAFEEVAADLFAATGGNGQQWEQAAYLGRSIDPENPLYSSKGESSAAPVSAGVAAVATTAAVAAVAATETFLSEPAEEEQELQALAAGLDEESSLDFEFEMPAVEPQPSSQLDNLPPKKDDVHLDFGAGIDSPSFDLELPSSDQTATEDKPLETEEDSLMALDLPIDLDKSFSTAEPEAKTQTPDVLSAMPELATPVFSSPDLTLPDLDLNLEMGAAEELAEAQALADFNAQLSAAEESSLDMPEMMAEPVLSEEENIDLKFDFNETALDSEVSEIESPIDLDLEMAGGSMEEMDFTADDPVQTKIDLARAYIDMGDVEGAREILQEAEQEGNPQQQEVARTLLTNL